jgi:hypothetical protein
MLHDLPFQEMKIFSLPTNFYNNLKFVGVDLQKHQKYFSGATDF